MRKRILTGLFITLSLTISSLSQAVESTCLDVESAYHADIKSIDIALDTQANSTEQIYFAIDTCTYTLSPSVDYGEFDVMIDKAIVQVVISTDKKLFSNDAVMTNNNFERMY